MSAAYCFAYCVYILMQNIPPVIACGGSAGSLTDTIPGATGLESHQIFIVSPKPDFRIYA